MAKDLLTSKPYEILRAADIEAGLASNSPASKVEATILSWGKEETIYRVHR
jgi:hypothetical protein